MNKQKIDTRLVYGFLEGGKTSFIQECILQDYFHKYGTTLILCFEQGVLDYDTKALLKKRTHVAYYEGEKNITEFCLDHIKDYQPDRIYVEMNVMLPGLRELLPDRMNISYVTTRIDWSTLNLYYINFKQILNQMVAESHQITFWGCPSKELLEPYSQGFRLMNHEASYLRQDPLGYHEKAFDLYIPFSLEDQIIEINQSRYLPFWLDAADHPEHYEGKTLVFSDPLELRCKEDNESWIAGRVVMTCCMSDLQFMGFKLSGIDSGSLDGGWIRLEAVAFTGIAEYGRKALELKIIRYEAVMPPEKLILSLGSGA